MEALEDNSKVNHSPKYLMTLHMHILFETCDEKQLQKIIHRKLIKNKLNNRKHLKLQYLLYPVVKLNV